MPLEVLVILVVVGIGGVVLLTRALGWARPAKFASAEDAKNHFSQDHPELTADEAWLSEDNLSALVLHTDKTLGLIFSFGDKYVTRRLTPEMILTVTVDDRADSILAKIALSDFTAPAVNMIFGRRIYDDKVRPALEQLTDIKPAVKAWR